MVSWRCNLCRWSEFDVNYYNSIFIHPMLNDILKIMRKYSIGEGELLDVQLMRSKAGMHLN